MSPHPCARESPRFDVDDFSDCRKFQVMFTKKDVSLPETSLIADDDADLWFSEGKAVSAAGLVMQHQTLTPGF